MLFISAGVLIAFVAGGLIYSIISTETRIVQGEILSANLVKDEDYVTVFPFIGYQKTAERLYITVNTTDGRILGFKTEILTLKVGDKIEVRITEYPLPPQEKYEVASVLPRDE